jgi:hypothetical protein
MKPRLRTYTAYSIGCAVVWAVIVTVTQTQADSQRRNNVLVGCLGWWAGWLSASIARVVYPPPRSRRSTGAAT